jgi:cell division protein FtsB
VRRLLWGAGALAVLAFAIEGGEYGTSDLYRQRARRRSLMASIDSLQQQVDSLSTLRKRLETDPALQERIAREEFGMVKGEKELLYRLVDPRADSAPDAVPGTRRP